MYYELLHEFIKRLQKMHRIKGYPLDYRHLAEQLDIKIAYQNYSMAYTLAGWEPVIYINRLESKARQRFTGMHEICHVLAHDYGIEDALIDHFGGDADDAQPYLEKFCNVGASYLLMPQPYIDRAIDYWGYSAMLIPEISKTTGATLHASMRRVVHLHEDSSVAGFIISGHTVLDVTRHHFKLPMRAHQVLPETHPIFQVDITDDNTRVCVEDTDLWGTLLPGTRKRVGLVIANW